MMKTLTMELNREAVLNELSKYERGQELPPLLEGLLARIAKTGDTMFPWGLVKSILLHKLENCLREFQPCQPGDAAALSRLLRLLEGFHSAPFTIQRLCELVTDPRQHYRRADKFLRGLEKNILVVSTVEPRSLVDQPAHLNGAEADDEPTPEGSSSKRPLSQLYDSDQDETNPVPAKSCKLDSPPHTGSTPPSDSLGDLKLDPAPDITSPPTSPQAGMPLETPESAEQEEEPSTMDTESGELAPMSPGQEKQVSSSDTAEVEMPADSADPAEPECPAESSFSAAETPSESVCCAEADTAANLKESIPVPATIPALVDTTSDTAAADPEDSCSTPTEDAAASSETSHLMEETSEEAASQGAPDNATAPEAEPQPPVQQMEDGEEDPKKPMEQD